MVASFESLAHRIGDPTQLSTPATWAFLSWTERMLPGICSPYLGCEVGRWFVDCWDLSPRQRWVQPPHCLQCQSHCGEALRALSWLPASGLFRSTGLQLGAQQSHLHHQTLYTTSKVSENNFWGDKTECPVPILRGQWRMSQFITINFEAWTDQAKDDVLQGTKGIRASALPSVNQTVANLLILSDRAKPKVNLKVAYVGAITFLDVWEGLILKHVDKRPKERSDRAAVTPPSCQAPAAIGGSETGFPR